MPFSPTVAQRAALALTSATDRLDDISNVANKKHRDALNAAQRILNSLFDGNVDQAVVDLLVLSCGMNESDAIALNRTVK